MLKEAVLVLLKLLTEIEKLLVVNPQIADLAADLVYPVCISAGVLADYAKLYFVKLAVVVYNTTTSPSKCKGRADNCRKTYFVVNKISCVLVSCNYFRRNTRISRDSEVSIFLTFLPERLFFQPHRCRR